MELREDLVCITPRLSLLFIGCALRTDTLPILQFGVNTFFRHVEFTALDDKHRLRWLVTRVLGYVLDLIDYLVAFQHLAENNMTTIEPAVGVSVRPSILDTLEPYLVMAVVMKNCDPLVSFPALAMLSRPFLVCFSLKFSSANFSP